MHKEINWLKIQKTCPQTAETTIMKQTPCWACSQLLSFPFTLAKYFISDKNWIFGYVDTAHHLKKYSMPWHMDHVTAKNTSSLALVQEHLMMGTETLLKNTRRGKGSIVVSKIALQIPLWTVIVLTFKRKKERKVLIEI